MLQRFFLFAGLIFLSSCAYVIDRQVQEVTLVTPGAEDAICYMYVEGLRYKVYPPQTVNISKSYKDMRVDCIAPGNRRREVFIEPMMSDNAPWNVVNGVIPGTSWDMASNSLFTYPEVITVDFTGAPLLPEALPAHNNPDIRQPEEYKLEEFTSGLPRLNSDVDSPGEPLRRRQKIVPAENYIESGITEYDGPGRPADKGDLSNVLDGLTTSSTRPAAPVDSMTRSSMPSGPIPATGIGVMNPMPAGPAAPEQSGPPVPNP